MTVGPLPPGTRTNPATRPMAPSEQVGFFMKRADEANNGVFAYMMCRPKTVNIKGHMSSLSNLKDNSTGDTIASSGLA